MSTTRSCPSCASPVVVDGVFPPWCEQCGWGVRAPAPPRLRTAIERAGVPVARRLDRRLFEGLAAQDDLRPRVTPGRVAGFVVALGVLAVWLALIAGAIWFVAVVRSPIAMFIGLGLGGVALLMRPRLGRLPKKGIVEQGAAPELHAVIAEAAAALGVRPPDLIVIDRHFNASWGVVGLRRRRELTLGLPLLATLESPELVALIAHELAHERNGDPLRGFVVWSSVSGLAALWVSLSPQFGENHRAVFGSLFEDVATVVLNVLAVPVRLVLELQFLLMLRESHRAEYLADDLAASIAGTEGVVALMEKLLTAGYVDSVLQRHAIEQRAGGAATIGLVRSAVRDVPERERERRRRAARLETDQIYTTHPRTARRIELLQRRAERTASVVLTAERQAAIEAELAPLAADIGRQLVDGWHRGRRLAA